MDGDKWGIFAPILFDRIGGIIREYMTGQVTAYGLSGTHCMHLVAIDLLGSPTTSQLAKFLDMDQGNVCRSVQHLAFLEMVTTDKNTVSPRNYRIYLTDLGRGLGRQILKGLENEMRKDLDGVTEEELTVARNVLVKFLRNASPSADAAPDPEMACGNYLDVIDPARDVAPPPAEQAPEEPPAAVEDKAAAPDVRDTVIVIAPSTDGGRFGYAFSIYESGKMSMHSALYTTENECMEVADRVMRCADSPVSDMTLKRPRPVEGTSVYEISFSGSGRFVFSLVDSDLRVLMTSKEYSNKTYCKRDIEALKRNLPFASISSVGS